MSYVTCKTLRFDEHIYVKNGIVSSDNENGKNGFVITNDNRAFDVINNSKILDLYKSTNKFTLDDLKICIFGHTSNETSSWITVRPSENCIIDVEEMDNGYLRLTMGEHKMHFNCVGLSCFEYLFLGSSFEKYVNSTIEQFIKVNNEDCIFTISNAFTGFIYGIVKSGINNGYSNFIKEICDDMIYENDHMRISMKDLGVTTFYDVIVEDIKNNSTVLNTRISSFEDLTNYLNMCEYIYDFDEDNLENVKNVKVYALYDRMCLKGKSTLVPCENSSFVGYFVSFGVKKFFGCPPCECGYVRITENTFFKDLDTIKRVFETEPKELRKNNINSNLFELHRGNDIRNPEIYYISTSGEKIDLIHNKAYISICE